LKGDEETVFSLYYLPEFRLVGDKQPILTDVLQKTSRLAVPFPKPPGYPATPRTLGEAIKKRRMDLGLLQREVADLLGVNKKTVTTWEVGRRSPSLTWWPKLKVFLGESQWPITPAGPPQTLGAAIRQRRLEQGLRQEDPAPLLGVKPDTVASWETGVAFPLPRHFPKLLAFLGKHQGLLLPDEDPTCPATFGEVLRRRRLALGLSRAALAARLGTTASGIADWEHGRASPSLRHRPWLTELFGEDLWPLQAESPQDGERSLGERLRQRRLALGLSQRSLARLLGVRAKSIALWEKGTRTPRGRYLDLVEAFLKSDPSSR